MPPARQATVRNSEKRSLFVFAGDTPANTHPGHDEGVLARVRAVTATELARMPDQPWRGEDVRPRLSSRLSP
jgi:hypothetical protein